MRVVVLGAGNHSLTNHGPSLRDLAAEEGGTIELAAVCDLDRGRADAYAVRFGFARGYTDAHEMIRRERPDAIVAVTPIAATRAVAGELLAYRIPLLIEKPPGRDEREAAELADIAARHGTPHMVSFNRRFVPAVLAARRWIARREDGEAAPRLVVARMLRRARREPDFIVGTGIHLVDTVLSFAGAPAEVRSRRWSSAGGAQCCEARIGFRDGGEAVVSILPDAGVDQESYELLGSGWAVSVEGLVCEMAAAAAGGTPERLSLPAEAPLHVRHGCLEETRAFLAAVAGSAPFRPTLDEALHSVRTAAALDRGD